MMLSNLVKCSPSNDLHSHSGFHWEVGPGAILETKAETILQFIRGLPRKHLEHAGR